MEFVPLAVGALIVYTATKLLKYATNGQWENVATLLVVHGVGVGVAFLLGASSFADGIDIGGRALGSLNAAGTALFGVALGSAASGANDARKAVDGNDSSVQPKLFSGR